MSSHLSSSWSPYVRLQVGAPQCVGAHDWRPHWNEVSWQASSTGSGDAPRPHGSLLISCYPAVYLRGEQNPLYAHQKKTRNAFACQALQRDVWRATKNKIDRGFLNCWSNHCGNLNERFGHDVGGPVHVTTNVRAKGDVGVGAAAITG